MKKFIPGLILSEKFYWNGVKIIIDRHFPGLPYSAGLIDYGSDVLGFDTPVSMDHQWGPRLSIFLSPSDLKSYGEILDEVFAAELPEQIDGFSISFSGTKSDYIRIMQKSESGKVKHLIRLHSPEEFFLEHLGYDIHTQLLPLQWLLFPQQKLMTIKRGKIFLDGLDMNRIRQKLNYYPSDVWYYLMGCEWMRINTEDAFVGRCGDAGDELGSRLIASRIIGYLMNLYFLMEKKYIPYSKWFGTAFQELQVSQKLSGIFHSVLNSATWKKREKYLCRAYSLVAQKHNALNITAPLETQSKKYYSREYLVLASADFAESLFSLITDQQLRSLVRAGNIDQITDSIKILSSVDNIQKIGGLYL